MSSPSALYANGAVRSTRTTPVCWPLTKCFTSAAGKALPPWPRLLAVVLLHRAQDLIQVEAGRLLPLRVLLERRQELAHVVLGRHEQEGVVHHPVVVRVRRDVRALVRIGPEIEELRHPQGHEWLGPDLQCPAHPLFHENDLPVVVA